MSWVRIASTILLFATALPKAFGADVYTPGQKTGKTWQGFASKFIENNCLDCHDNDTKEGGLTLENLGPVDETNALIWKSVWAQVTLKEMPPRENDQPETSQRLLFSDWIVEELTRAMKDGGGFHAHLDASKGNYLDHDLLFGTLPESIQLIPTSSPARLWRVTPEEHITRLNELINKEAAFDPSKPGLRAHGDAVPRDHVGRLKLYFGTDRITRWQGGNPYSYAGAVKAVPAVLASERTRGLENYPDLYSVNGSELTQILRKASDILRYMAYGPLSIAEPHQITDDPQQIKELLTYKKGEPSDRRQTPGALVYHTRVVRPLTPVYDLIENPGVSDPRVRAAVDYLLETLTLRPPRQAESDRYLTIVKQSIDKLGKEEGVFLGLSAIFLDRHALFHPELAEYGTPDEHGRVMLQDWELGLAVNHALRYLKPDEPLKQAILSGRMRTRADVKREVERMLTDDAIRKPRVMQFFRDYFDYDLGGYVCKDNMALAATGVRNREQSYYHAMFDAVINTDRLVELILEEDKDVLKQLLTTQKVVVSKHEHHAEFFGRMRTTVERQAALAKEIAELEARLKANPNDRKVKQKLSKKKQEGTVSPNEPAELTGSKIYARVPRRSWGRFSPKPERILGTAPEGERLGILTHPAWLVSHSDAMDNHAIHRGIWIRERLLGGGIPDVPITVDAMLPDEPESTLRHRMRVTRENYCWSCHQKMDPLGLPFEMYNHVGIYRTTELDTPVDTTGEIIDSGDTTLDGKVNNAIEMIQKLAESERTEQVFVRHAFRFWMGRNETLNDRPVLQAAHKAYKDSGGSMKALITSLLTSDAFLYRKVRPKS